MTCVILTDAIDLSVGSVLALSTALCAGMIANGVPAGLAMILALVLGTGFGIISGLLVTKGRLQPFIATLITMTVYRGLIMIFTGGKPISNLGDSFVLKLIGKGNWYHIPLPVILLILIFIGFYVLLNKTTFGRAVYATGSNAKCAKLAGINIHKTKIAAYAISGFMAALSGLILLSRLGSAQPTLGSGYELDAIAAVALGGTSMSGGRGKIYGTFIGVFILLSRLGSAQPTLGSGYELDAIAAVALGGTSMSGGRGKIYGTFIGVLIIAVLNNGLNILGVSSYYQDVIKGLVILVAVLSDRKR